jgi:hypothetical protein
MFFVQRTFLALAFYILYNVAMVVVVLAVVGLFVDISPTTKALGLVLIGNVLLSICLWVDSSRLKTRGVPGYYGIAGYSPWQYGLMGLLVSSIMVIAYPVTRHTIKRNAIAIDWKVLSREMASTEDH